MELSREELVVLSDRHHYEVKASINRKLDASFSLLKEEWMPLVGTWNFPLDNIDRTRGKVFRGENYQGYPYSLLDFPRHFSKEAVFAIRTMCWWGHEFSITLHIQGAALVPLLPNLERRLEAVTGKDLMYCVNSTPWSYDFSKKNYEPVVDLEQSRMMQDIREKGFVKLSRPIALGQAESLSELGKETIGWFAGFVNS